MCVEIGSGGLTGTLCLAEVRGRLEEGGLWVDGIAQLCSEAEGIQQ